jgi:hypothetical protein
VSSSLPSSGLGLLTPYSCLSTVRLHPGTLLHVLVSALSSCSSPLSDMLKGLLDLMEHLGISKTMPQRLALPRLSLSSPSHSLAPLDLAEFCLKASGASRNSQRSSLCLPTLPFSSSLTDGTFFTHCPIDIWELLHHHMSLASSTGSVDQLIILPSFTSLPLTDPL